MSRSGSLAPSTQPDRLWYWLVEAGPLVFVVLVLWVKLIYIGLLLPSVSWAGGEPLHLFAALRASPDMFTATLACLLLPVPLLILLPRLARAFAAWVLDLAVTLVAVGDLIHVRFYADVTSVSALAQTSMLHWVVDSIVSLLDPADLRFFLDLPIGFVGLLLYARRCRQIPSVSVLSRMRLGLAPLVLALLLALPTTRLASTEAQGIFGYSTIRLESSRRSGCCRITSLTLSSVWSGDRDRSATPTWRASERSWNVVPGRRRRPRSCSGSRRGRT